jgi:hypothetical protein
MHRVGLLLAALAIATACGSGAPTAPGPSSSSHRLLVSCSAPSILAGDIVICLASRDGVALGSTVTWTSSDPSVAAHQGIGIFLGKKDGQVTLTASDSGQTASAALSVQLQDVLRATAAAYQGPFAVGSTVTLTLQGFYGVASADSGTLMLLINDQTGNTIAASSLIVPHGGDRYLLEIRFTLRPGTTRICRSGVLRIGPTTLTVIPDASLVPCFDVAPSPN